MTEFLELQNPAEIQNMRDNLTRTSHSEVEAYLKCERSHFYGYGEAGTGVRAKTESDALVRGNVGHHALAVYYAALKAGVGFNDRFAAATQDISDQIKGYDLHNPEVLLVDLLGLVGQYIVNYRETDETWEIIDVEKEFYIPIGDEFYLKIIIDLIARIPNQGITVIDHKFVNDFYSLQAQAIAPQLPKYLGAARSIGLNTSGAMYNQIRYRKTKDNAEDHSLKFSRDLVPISTERVLQTMAEQIKVARRIRHLKTLPEGQWAEKVVRVANTMICNTCAFQELCVLDLNKQDKTLALEYNYKSKSSRGDQNG